MSLTFQRSECGAEDYYDLAIDILAGDSDALLALVSRLPDAHASKREDVRAVHARRMEAHMTMMTDTTMAATMAANNDNTATASAAVAALRFDARNGIGIGIGNEDGNGNGNEEEEEENRALAAAMERAHTLQWGGHGTGWQLPPSSSASTNNNNTNTNTTAAVAPAAAAAAAAPPRVSSRPAAAAVSYFSSGGGGVMASLQAALDEEEEDLCPVCLVEPPRVACDPCGHQLCVECLTLWKQTSASYYAATKNGSGANRTTCPMCRCDIKGFRHVVHGEKDKAAATAAKLSSSRRHDGRGGSGGGGDGGGGVRSGTGAGVVDDGDGDGDDDDENDGGSGGKTRRKASRGQRARLKKAAAAAANSGDGDVFDADAPGCYGGVGDSWRNDINSNDVNVNVNVNAAPIIVWFRQDLRLRDNPALHAASRQGVPIVPVFVWCPEEAGPD